MVGHFFEVGPAPGGNPITFGELQSWQECTGVVLDEFEATALAAMSRAYLGMLHDGRNPACPCPVKRERTQEEKVARDRQMIEAREARKRKQKG